MGPHPEANVQTVSALLSKIPGGDLLATERGGAGAERISSPGAKSCVVSGCRDKKYFEDPRTYVAGRSRRARESVLLEVPEQGCGAMRVPVIAHEYTDASVALRPCYSSREGGGKVPYGARDGDLGDASENEV